MYVHVQSILYNYSSALLFQQSNLYAHITHYTPFLGQSPFQASESSILRSSNLSLPQTSSIKYVPCSLNILLFHVCLFDLRSEQVASSNQMPAQHYLPSPGGATYVMSHGPMYSQAAATPGLIPQCEFITPYICSCIITFKSLARLSSFTYGYQPPYLTPSTSLWPQCKPTMHAR